MLLSSRVGTPDRAKSPQLPVVEVTQELSSSRYISQRVKRTRVQSVLSVQVFEFLPDSWLEFEQESRTSHAIADSFEYIYICRTRMQKAMHASLATRPATVCVCPRENENYDTICLLR